ncbi:MAG: RNA methyltransferase, partial [Anaerolineae bacterium]|nr:RNA methyltransferase [Anaerolineae bacterium]
DTQNPQGIAAVFSIPYPDLPKNPQRVLILDAIREPGNMGTILRTAGAAGAEIVLLAPGCVDPYNPKAVRSGMGAHFRVPIVEVKWYEVQAYCEKLNIYLAAGEGQTRHFDVDWTQPWALVIGNEAHGIADEARNLQATSISIPMSNATESLNASMAAAVILFEAQRQRLQS